MHYLGKKWDDVYEKLAEEKVDFTYEITYPVGRAISCGNLRVARTSQAQGKLKFILLHDRFDK